MQKYVLKSFERVNQEKVNKLSEFDVATVYEAQGKIGLVNDSLKPIGNGQFICGTAVTVTCHAGDNLMIHAAIEVCQPNDVLVITTIGESKSGMIGELIVEALRKRKVQGVIIEAGVRDTERIKEMGFPVWSKAIFSEGTTKNKGGWVNAPTVCGGTTVNPGDLIMADDDGVVVTQKDDVDMAIEASTKRMEKEGRTKQKISNGELSLDFYRLRDVLESNEVVYYENEQEMEESMYGKVK